MPKQEQSTTQSEGWAVPTTACVPGHLRTANDTACNTAFQVDVSACTPAVSNASSKVTVRETAVGFATPLWSITRGPGAGARVPAAVITMYEVSVYRIRAPTYLCGPRPQAEAQVHARKQRSTVGAHRLAAGRGERRAQPPVHLQWHEITTSQSGATACSEHRSMHLGSGVAAAAALATAQNVRGVLRSGPFVSS